VSAGGNDALGQTGVFAERAGTVAEALLRLAAIRREFERRYRVMLDEVLALGLPTSVCTIYDVRFPDPDLREVAWTALALLNDVITREAARRGLPVLDLRVLFDEDADFANPIEPSAQGSAKLARGVWGSSGARRRAPASTRPCRPNERQAQSVRRSSRRRALWMSTAATSAWAMAMAIWLRPVTASPAA
jgi:hypothetical protein